MPESAALAGRLNIVKKGWRARRASQKPAGGILCARSDKISKAILRDACWRFACAGKTETHPNWKCARSRGQPTKNSQAAQRFALLALGRAWTLLGSRKNSKPEKCSTRSVPQNPQRPVHPIKMAGHHFSRRDTICVLRTLCWHAFDFMTRCLKQDNAANLTKLLHELNY